LGCETRLRVPRGLYNWIVAHIEEVPVGVLLPDRFLDVIGPERFQAFEQKVKQARTMLEGKVVWNVNSTARGGGVAEMLRSLLAYARGAGVDARWVVIEGWGEFFRITKRLHNNLHGAPGDGGELGENEARFYEEVTNDNAEELAALVRPGDFAIVHDPQPAGLCAALKDTGARVMWRCHVGLDRPNDTARGAWKFLHRYVEPADAFVFSRRAFVWEGLPDEKINVIPPSIDVFSPKNQELGDDNVAAILNSAAVVPSSSGGDAATYTREDGTPARVDRTAQMFEASPVPAGVPLVVQVSRWDRLKDPLGVIQGFADVVANSTDAHLIVAGPEVEAIADDPEGAEVLAECRSAWEQLPRGAKERVHLACLPMEDGEENAAIVNALQRRADIIVQKSLAEGFGLTVAEGQWKGKPVVASRIGGIQDQVIDGVTGLLIDDPRDLDGYGRAVTALVDDPDRARAMGREAKEKVRADFLGPRHLAQYVDLLASLG
jgi:trehalose synthase